MADVGLGYKTPNKKVSPAPGQEDRLKIISDLTKKLLSCKPVQEAINQIKSQGGGGGANASLVSYFLLFWSGENKWMLWWWERLNRVLQKLPHKTRGKPPMMTLQMLMYAHGIRSDGNLYMTKGVIIIPYNQQQKPDNKRRRVEQPNSIVEDERIQMMQHNIHKRTDGASLFLDSLKAVDRSEEEGKGTLSNDDELQAKPSTLTTTAAFNKKVGSCWSFYSFRTCYNLNNFAFTHIYLSAHAWILEYSWE